MSLTDADALDRLALFMGRPGQWNGGDVCEVAAELIVATGRPAPGGPLAGDCDGDSDEDAPPAYVTALAERRATTREEQLAALIDEGLTFADCLKAFAARQTDEARRYIALAREEVHRDGEIEIDDNAITSGSSDKGDYVLAWAWVDDPEGDDDDG